MSDARCPIQKPTIAIETTRKMLTVLQCRVVAVIIAALTLGAMRCPAQQLTNGNLLVTVNSKDGSYQFAPTGGQSALQASTGALVDHTWRVPRVIPRIRCLSRRSATH
jgi:hypothetical protein